MRRNDDRYGTTRLYVGRLASRTRSRDLDHLFSKYGRVRDVDMKHDYAFVEFSDPRDADDARYSLNGRDFDGSRLLVEFARGGPRGPGGSRDSSGRGPLPGSGRCFNCGIDGHWARDCKAGDWKNKCYRCGERGHIERNCQNSPKNLKRGRSYSRSPSHGRGRSRSRSYNRGRSYSRSRSPPRRSGRSSVRERSMSPSRSPPPKVRKSSPPPPEKKRSPLRDGSRSPSPMRLAEAERNVSDNGSPRRDLTQSPISPELESSPADRRYKSPPVANGRSVSPRDRDGEDDDEGDHASPKGGSESPQD